MTYNEIEPYAVQWLRNLERDGHIRAGRVDTRSIKDIRGVDSAQFHAFAGAGVWSYALRAAGWPDDRPVWTGSCPCQPFSNAGARKGFADPRHLWPDWFRLIAAERPQHIFGEQVAHPDGYAWLDVVQTDLENAGYTVGAVVTPASGFGAPHGRHRIYFVAHTDTGGREQGERHPAPLGHGHAIAPDRGAGELAHTADAGRERRRTSETGGGTRSARGEPERFRDIGGVGQPTSGRRERQREEPEHRQPMQTNQGAGWPRPVNDFWRAADWLQCTDGKWRPVEPGTFPLAYGLANRVGKLRAYGNALCAPQAIEFVKAFMDHEAEQSNGSGL